MTTENIASSRLTTIENNGQRLTICPRQPCKNAFGTSASPATLQRLVQEITYLHNDRPRFGRGWHDGDYFAELFDGDVLARHVGGRGCVEHRADRGLFCWCQWVHQRLVRTGEKLQQTIHHIFYNFESKAWRQKKKCISCRYTIQQGRLIDRWAVIYGGAEGGGSPVSRTRQRQRQTL